MGEEDRDQEEKDAKVLGADVPAGTEEQVGSERAERQDLDRALPVLDRGGPGPLDARGRDGEAGEAERDLEKRGSTDHRHPDAPPRDSVAPPRHSGDMVSL